MPKRPRTLAITRWKALTKLSRNNLKLSILEMDEGSLNLCIRIGVFIEIGEGTRQLKSIFCQLRNPERLTRVGHHGRKSFQGFQ